MLAAVATQTEPRTPQGGGRAAAAASALTAAALWGGMYVVSKDTFSEIPPITLGAVRLILAAAGLFAFLRARGPLRRPHDASLVVAGVLLAITMVVQFVGTDLATASAGAVLTTTTPLFLVPLAWVFLHERPGWKTVVAVAVGMAGVLLAVEGGEATARGPWGAVLLLLSAATWAAYTIASAPVARRDGPLVAVAWACVYAVPIVLALSLFETGRWTVAAFTDGSTMLAIAYLGLASGAAAWLLWIRGVAGLPAAVVGAFFFVQPIVGGALARVFLDERLTLRFAAGAAMILIGVVLALGGSRDAVPQREETR
ncbi:MAG TPA: EamA family transporter [Actinomycetota bacterium]|nr:EamA family transporter [Actinomycetota bacterium]